MNGDFSVRKFSFDSQVLTDFASLLMQKITANPDLFLINTKREKFAPALKDTRTIHLRHPKIDSSKIVSTKSTAHVIECLDDPLLLSDFPEVKELVSNVGKFINGPAGFYKHGRYFITMLKKGEKIGWHIDEGAYFKYYRRFHVPLQVNGNCFFQTERGKTSMFVGELCELNNCIPHMVDNSDGNDRYHLIFDCL